MEQYADMVNQHYNYHNNNEIRSIGDYQVSKEHTDTNSAVFVSPKEVVIAMRGTDLQEQESRNILGALGTETALQIAQMPNLFSGSDSYSKLVNETNEKMKNLSNLHPEKEMVIAGHSRSGKVAIDIGKEHNIRTYAYNPASLPHDVGKGRLERLENIISSFAGYGLENTVLVEPKDILMSGSANKFFEDKTHHSIRNFISGDNNAPIKEILHFHTETHDNTFVPLNPNYNWCRLNPYSPLCRRIIKR
jgi:hypothetical protein